MPELDTFTTAYIEAALWSSTDIDSGDTFLDENYEIEDIAPETLAEMVDDCADFQEGFRDELERAYDVQLSPASPGWYYPEARFYTPAQAGHDFWLTRNGHGAGFWDRGLGEIGDKLTEAAHPYSTYDLYVGDDGKIHA